METNKLEILIELELFPRLKLLTEGNFSRKQIKQEQQQVIIHFINKLPESYKKLPNRDEVIAKTLQRMGMKTEWGEKKIEEFTFMTEGKKDKQKNSMIDSKSTRNKTKKQEQER